MLHPGRNLTMMMIAAVAGMLSLAVSAKTTEAPVAPAAKAKAAAVASPKAKPAAAPSLTATPTGNSPVARGTYLAGILGCAGCHTPWGPNGRDEAKLYGGQPAREPGRSGTPNISSDPATGLGKWTDAQILAAIRDGKRPDGARLSPHMPSGSYHGLTDADGAALVAFLRTVKPVVNKIDRVAPDAAESAGWPAISSATGFTDPAEPAGHGAYLATLLRCEGCHTPPDGSPAAGKRYAGGKEFKSRGGDAAAPLYASNLTPDMETGIGKWTPAQIVAAIRELVDEDGAKIKGPMNFHKDDWEKLTDADANAVAAFLKSLPPVKNRIIETAQAPAK